MISWDQRNQQRGAYRQPQFLLKMRELGFSEVEPTPSRNHGFVLHEFTHPAAGDHRFQVKAGVSYAKAVRDFTTTIEETIHARASMAAEIRPAGDDHDGALCADI